MKRLLRAAALLLPMILWIPASAGAAGASFWPVEPTCTAQATTTDGRTMSLYVEIVAVPPPVPPVPHRAWCNVYVGGSLALTVEGDHIGLVIVGAEVIHGLPPGIYTVCGAREGRDC